MKKSLTILITVVLLASGMQVSIDRHYCGGELADIKLSLTGRMASCGMEKTENKCPDYPVFNKKCCEDQISFYSISSKYFPGFFKLSHPSTGKDIPLAHISFIVLRNLNTSDFIAWELPPGDKSKSSLTLSEICVFRI
jgi:hypothetical protein